MKFPSDKGDNGNISTFFTNVISFINERRMQLNQQNKFSFMLPIQKMHVYFSVIREIFNNRHTKNELDNKIPIVKIIDTRNSSTYALNCTAIAL